MKDNRESLLRKIMRLYSEVFIVSMHNRIDRYHAFSYPEKNDEINHSFYRLIDEIVADVTSNEPSEHYYDRGLRDEWRVHNRSKYRRFRYHSGNMASMAFNGLSVYLKQQYAREYNPSMVDKLKQCVWDHLHATHRFARFGDEKTARLHADIACNALSTLSSYMSPAEYNRFFEDINDKIPVIACKAEQSPRHH